MDKKYFISSLKFRGGNLEYLKEKNAHECLICSPADTGKTMCGCYKLIVACMQVPKSHCAIVRKTYTSLQDSVVKTFDRISEGLPIRKLGGSRADKYVFQNGSEIVLIGMDHPEKLLSSEWALIFVVQAEELSEGEWEIAASRATGRGTDYPHPQIYGDLNPSFSKHWIRRRKSIKLITGSIKDNPELYDDAGNPTAEGERRAKLSDELYTGVRRQRLLYGIWATAEGAVYEQFQPDIHVKIRPMEEMKVIGMAMDVGFTNPSVILCIGEDLDGRMHIFKEFYKKKQDNSTLVAKTKLWSNELGNPLIVCDEAAAALIADLRSEGLRVVGAKGRTPDSTGKNIIIEGIRVVQDRLKKQGDGLPRLTIDPSCVETINEFESYRWMPVRGSVSTDDLKDEPLKDNDHAMDAVRYYVVARMTTSGFSSAAGFVTGDIGSSGDSDSFDFETIDWTE